MPQRTFLRIPKFLHSLGKSQVSKSFQGHSYWLLIMNYKTQNMYVLFKKKIKILVSMQFSHIDWINEHECFLSFIVQSDLKVSIKLNSHPGLQRLEPRRSGFGVVFVLVIEVWLIYSVVLVSDTQHSASVMHICICYFERCISVSFFCSY